MVAIAVYIVMTLGFGVQPVNSQVFPGPSIVDDTYFTNTVYFKIVTGFASGMQFSKNHNDAETCISFFSALMNDYYFLNKNF